MLTNEKLEALKAERKRLLPPNAGTFVSAMQLACKSINFIDELLAIREAGDEAVEKKMFPLQTSRQAPPGPRQIPWSVAEIAYGEYSRRYGKGQSLERLAERGGFGWCEMDMFYPDWRKDVSEIEILRQQLREAQAEIERLTRCLKKANDGFEEHERLWYLEQNKTEALTAERDEARKELAALKSAPGMQEVDALEK